MKEKEKTLINENLISSIKEDINKVLKQENSSQEIEIFDFIDEEDRVNDFVDTGFYSLNYIISKKIATGGYPVGRITEIFGDPSTGKTLLSILACLNAIKKGYITYYIDTEAAFDYDFAKMLASYFFEGQNPNDILKKILYTECDTIEELRNYIMGILDVTERKKIYEKTPSLVVVDGVAFLSTIKETEDVKKGNEKIDMTKARLLRQFFRVLKNDIKDLKISLLFTNQLTYNISTAPFAFGEQKTTTGGTAIPFASSVRLKLKSEKVMTNKRMTGLLIKASTKKNRLFIPFKEAQFTINFFDKPDKYDGLLDCLINDALLKKEKGIYKLGKYEIKSEEDLKQIPIEELEKEIINLINQNMNINVNNKEDK